MRAGVLIPVIRDTQKMLKNMSFKGIVVGAVTVIATNIAFSILMPLVFSDLIRTGQLDVLIVSFWPQIYTLASFLISGVFGIYICSVVAHQASWPNAFGVTLISALMAFVMNQPVSEWSSAPPDWFTVASYLLLVPALVVGHYSAKLSCGSPGHA